MAIAKSIIINVDTKDGVKELDRLESSFEDVYGEVLPLTGKIGELEDQLYEMARAGESGSKEFRDLSMVIGDMKKTIIETDMVVDGLSMTTSQQLSGSMMGVVSGFELAQGAMGAFGAESEEVEAALLKVQSASAIADGLQGIKESAASFRALKNSIMATTVVQKVLTGVTRVFNAVLKANPIGLIITAIAALIAGIVALVKNFRAVTDWLGITDSASEEYYQNELKRIQDLQKEREKAFKKDQHDRDLAIRRAKAQGKETYEMELANHKAKVKFARTQLKLLAAEFKARQANNDLTAEESKEYGARAKELGEMIRSANDDILVMQDEHKKKLEDKEKAHQEKLAQERKAAYEKRKAEREKEAQEAEAARQKELERERAIAEEIRKAKIDAELAYIAEEEELAELIYQASLTEQQREITAIQDFYFEKIELAKQHGLDVTALEEEQAAKIAEIDKKYADEKAAREKEAADKKKEQDDKEIENKQAIEDAKLDMTVNALTAIGSITELFADRNEKAARAAFAVQKAVNIGLAVADTYKGATAAFASAAANPITIANPAFPSIMAGIAVAGGLANVAKIAATKFQGSSASGGGGTLYATPSAGAPRPAEFNIVGNSGTNQLAESLGQPMKAYVVGSEVTSQQSLDRNRVRNASI